MAQKLGLLQKVSREKLYSILMPMHLTIYFDGLPNTNDKSIEEFENKSFLLGDDMSIRL